MNSEELDKIRKRLCILQPLTIRRHPNLGIDYQAEPGDTFIVSFPRTGYTWTRHMIWSLNHEGAEFPKGQQIFWEYPVLEREGKDYVQACAKPRLIATHLPMDLVPKHPEAKYIFLVRNPKDVLVSRYHHQITLDHIKEGEFDAFVNDFLKGEVVNGDYLDHLRSYLPYWGKENCLFLFYEEHAANPEERVRKLAKFLGKTEISEEVIQKVVDNTQIDKMRQDQMRWQEFQGVTVVRQGKVGDWRNHLSKEQSEAIDEKYRRDMKGTIAQNWWKDIMSWE